MSSEDICYSLATPTLWTYSTLVQYSVGEVFPYLLGVPHEKREICSFLTFFISVLVDYFVNRRDEKDFGRMTSSFVLAYGECYQNVSLLFLFDYTVIEGTWQVLMK